MGWIKPLGLGTIPWESQTSGTIYVSGTVYGPHKVNVETAEYKIRVETTEYKIRLS